MDNLQSNQKITRSPLFKFLMLEFICLVLMISDKNNRVAQPIRDTLSLAAIPLIKIVEWPQELYQIAEIAVSRQARLIEENNDLKERLLDAELKVQQNISLSAENQRLRELLNASQNSPLTTSVAFVSNITQTQNKQQIIIDQGSSDGLFVGQAVLNLAGVIGQVDVLGRDFAHIILITDTSHAIPVEVLRTGLRTIAYGRGDHVFLAEIPTSANIESGDVLVTSGFGGRFPRGLQLAEVDDVSVSPERTFKTAKAIPFAQLNRLTEVFLVWPDQVAVIDASSPQDATVNDQLIEAGTASTTANQTNSEGNNDG
ncbi:rod shape-determining protein MreC [Marinicella sp. S1101]|uniref:rod shape-determining protein MreC n=1 Tax=Marinicella marina TaxID=2996016 RepID=UPI002260D85C|nr:rod shape-determining protein MreC [Marinicella marina]MCX7552526.1 rod shape-determining protein MreC [Marinicella marina]MDJ1139402.1 rod shape-determining protein MreC [Marinicella marina]